ncbi:HAD-IC family P-type ATPase [Patescibacteria group bacterium]|nr:HAD-IC family P-type ATPase [Patescibacteria group bacterium]MBU0964226.1 HAD-IC family P-type ATPase [Patescibacteria group bacterium]
MGKQYYNLSREEALKGLATSYSGLSSEEVSKRLNTYGKNKLPEEKPFSFWLLFLRQFKSALIYILLIAALVSFFLQDYINMYVILAAVGINVIVGFIQEFRAQKALEKLRRIVTLYARVRRNGREMEIKTEDIVPGDIVILSAGQKISADIRITQAVDLKIDEASLTGESFPIKKTDDKLSSAVIIAEQKNMAFMGTTVVAGTGEGVVVNTGHKTELGKIATLIKDTKEESTPLQKKLASLGRMLGIIILIISFFIFLVGIILKYDLKEMFTTAVALAVAAIPEGLVVVLTVILAIGMQRILKQKSLVRKLIAAETLGSITVICTDKTGTLTEGEMRVVKIITHDKTLNTDRHTDSKKAEEIPAKSFFLALKIGVLSSDAHIENPDEAIEHRTVIGMPTEKALVLAAAQTGMDLDQLNKENPRYEVVPFESDKRFMATLNKSRKDEKTIYFKGAPEVILGSAKKIDLDGKIVNLEEKKKNKLRAEYESLSSEGLRILALGFKEVDKNYSNLRDDPAILENLTFVGFAGIKDPLRREAKQTIKLCQEAGIRPVMLTGDHRLTAQAIAKELNLPHGSKNIIEGGEFEKLDEKKLKSRIADISVYARVNPGDKLRIIDAWQDRGEVVAMTGDGVNDAPALKSADIGVALGSGTDVAKETADIVLLDNNFSTIVKAVEQGRIIYDNIKKVVLYLMSDSFTEMIIISLSLLLGWPLPLLAAQILWINLVTDGFPNIALTVEPGEPDIMKQKPVAPKKSIVDFEMKFLIFFISLITGLLALGIFYYVWKTTGDLDKARTMTFAAVAIDSLLYVFSCRNLRHSIWHRKIFSNKYLILAVLAGFLVQLPAIYLPFFQNVFQTVSLSFADWLMVISLGLITIIAIEISKWLFLHKKIAHKLRFSKQAN